MMKMVNDKDDEDEYGEVYEKRIDPFHIISRLAGMDI